MICDQCSRDKDCVSTWLSFIRTSPRRLAWLPPLVSVALHDTVANRIIRELEQGGILWVQPWASFGTPPLGLPLNVATGRAYSGVNILLLWSSW